MAAIFKDRSPFYPGQPVPVELFVGRREQIGRILQRGVGQVEHGKPVAVFIEGEYGIGKSSVAGYIESVAEKANGLHGIYVHLGGVHNLPEMAEAVLVAAVRSGAFDPRRSEKVRNWLAKYVGKQEPAGLLTLNFEALKQDSPKISTPFGLLGFLEEAKARLTENGVKGIMLVLDEINGIAADPQFAHFIKGLVDTNAMSHPPLPLLLVVCGVKERRWEMIRNHQPIDRIFDVIEIAAMNEGEMKEFFSRAFESVQMRVDEQALHNLEFYSAGFPKIMHIVGDAAYWIDQDGIIDGDDAMNGLIRAAEEVGNKYVDPQVYNELRSKDYHAILAKIGGIDPAAMSFNKRDVVAGLTESQKGKFNNFLQKMKRLKVLKSGQVAGEYVFCVRMVRLYLWLKSLESNPSKT